MSYLKPRYQKILLNESWSTLQSIHKLSHEPSFVFASLEEDCFRNTSLIFYLINLHPVYLLHLLMYQQCPSAWILFLCVLFLARHSGYFLPPLSSQHPFHCAGKERKPSTRPPPPPLLHLASSQRSSCPHQGWVPSSPLAWRHKPILERNPEVPSLLHRYALKPSHSLLWLERFQVATVCEIQGCLLFV